VPDGADRLTYERGDVARVRAAVRTFAQASGLVDGAVDDLVLSADELATNSVRHGGGSGMITTWVRPDAVLVEFSDNGTITAPLVGRLRPGVRSYGGRGIFLVNHLCDLVQIRSGATGTRVRVTMWR
jgi:anti-sigma regulatory factor (Ser/Thr protein kinase)